MEPAFAAPIAGDYRISSGYGPRSAIAGAPGASRFHYGLDFAHATPGMGAAFEGTPVIAPNGGRVAQIYDGSGGEGYGVVIEHPDGRRSHLLHMAGAPSVSVGDVVGQGQPVGAVGSTGTSSGAHLDWRIQDENGEWIDPATLLDTAAPLPVREIGPTPTDALTAGSISAAAEPAPMPLLPSGANMELLRNDASGQGGGGLFNFGDANLPLLLAGMQMLSNSGPQVGRPNNLFEGVPQMILAGQQFGQEAVTDPVVVNGQLVDRNTGQVIGDYRDAQQEADLSSRMRDLQFLQENPQLMGAYQTLFGPGGTNITVNAGSDTPTGIGVGDTVGDEWATAYAGAGQAANLMNQLDTLENLYPRAITGSFAETRTELANIANTLGLPVDVEALGASQGVQAIVNQLALSVRNPDGAFGGMPGAVSNRDIQFLLNAVPNLTQTESGFRTAVDFMRRMARRQQQMSDLAVQYYDPNSATVNPAFLNAANELRQQPLFDDAARASVGHLTGNTPPASEGLLPTAPGQLPQGVTLPPELENVESMTFEQITDWMTNNQAAWLADSALRNYLQDLRNRLRQ